MKKRFDLLLAIVFAMVFVMGMCITAMASDVPKVNKCHTQNVDNLVYITQNDSDGLWGHLYDKDGVYQLNGAPDNPDVQGFDKSEFSDPDNILVGHVYHKENGKYSLCEDNPFFINYINRFVNSSRDAMEGEKTEDYLKENSQCEVFAGDIELKTDRFEILDEDFNTFDGTFEVGKTYYFSVYLNIEEEGTKFADTVTFSNDWFGRNIKEKSLQAYTMISVSSKLVIKEINITVEGGFPEARVGDSIEDYNKKLKAVKIKVTDQDDIEIGEGSSLYEGSYIISNGIIANSIDSDPASGKFKEGIKYYALFKVTVNQHTTGFAETVSVTKGWEKKQKQVGELAYCLAYPIKFGDAPKYKFIDVPSDKWYSQAGGPVEFVTENGIMSGTTDNTFSPDEACTRAMFVQILYNMEGKPGPGASNPFTDVKKKWYYDAITWAVENKVTSGINETTFGVDVEVSREMLAQFLYNYAVTKGYDTSKAADLTVFPDNNQVANWSKKAMSWANANEIINGQNIKGTIYLAPKKTATRAETAQMIMCFVKKFKK